MTEALQKIAELIHRASGIVLSASQYPALRAALARALPGVDPDSFLGLATDRVRGRSTLACLVDQVTIKETSFLRERPQLEAIHWHGLLENARATGGTTIRIWSAACATGEEVYTLAMLASEAFAPAEPPVRILGTDIAGTALAAAVAGRYRGRTVLHLDPALRDRYFIPDDGELVAGERLRRLVKFSRHNLVSDPIPPSGETPFDLVVCRNVLIYFDSETVGRVVASLQRALRGNGVLLLGAADILSARRPDESSLGQHSPNHCPDSREPRTLRRPLGREQEESANELLERALQAANEGRPDEAVQLSAKQLAKDPVNADGHFLRGVVELESGDARAAAGSLRRALYLDPSFGVAAFKLGRAYDALGDPGAARRAYEQALRTLEREDDRHAVIVKQVDLDDVAAACRARIRAITQVDSHPSDVTPGREIAPPDAVRPISRTPADRPRGGSHPKAPRRV